MERKAVIKSAVSLAARPPARPRGRRGAPSRVRTPRLALEGSLGAAAPRPVRHRQRASLAVASAASPSPSRFRRT